MRVARRSGEVATTAACVAWKHAAGELISKQTVVTGLQKQTLMVVVADIVWQRQMQSVSPQLIYKLNALLGTGTIRFIEYHVDTTAFIHDVAIDNPEPRATMALPAELITAAAAITEPKLRRSFLAAAESSMRYRQTRRQSS
jgi:hypothetical protein